MASVQGMHINECRLATFAVAHAVVKKRASNANSKGKKTVKWPHKNPTPVELAKAGFFYRPTASTPDNVSCFLCQKSLDGWEENDVPALEHSHHSPECGWAINACIELRNDDKDREEEDPLSEKMMEARRATFMDIWPHDGKRGWICRTEKMVEAGWCYCPTAESDDFVTCAYCNLSLDGWEPKDNPLDEHHRRSPDCIFFSLIDRKPVMKKGRRPTKSRTSKTSRLSTVSNISGFSEVPSLADIELQEGDSGLSAATTTTNSSMASKSHRKGPRAKNKKAATGSKGRKPRAKKAETVIEAPVPEPEDDDFKIKVDTSSPKLIRGKKRPSEDISTDEQPAQKKRQSPLQPPKRRLTKTRASKRISKETSQLEQYVATSPTTAQIEADLTVFHTPPAQNDVVMLSPPHEVEVENQDATEQHEMHVATIEASGPEMTADVDMYAELPEEENQSEELAPMERTPKTQTPAPTSSADKGSKISMKQYTPPIPTPRNATPSPSPQSADAESHPPSFRPAMSSKNSGSLSPLMQTTPPTAMHNKETTPCPSRRSSYAGNQLSSSHPMSSLKGKASNVPMKQATPPTPTHKEATPSPSPQSSDAENHPPSSRPATAPRTVASATRSTVMRIPLAPSTPTASPSKRNIIPGGLRSAIPWSAVDLETIFLASPSSRRGNKENMGFESIVHAKEMLTSPEKKMTVEEWIHYHATQAEERVRNECERIVGIFETQGVRALRALEGIETL